MTRDGWCCIRGGCISMNRAGDEHGPLVDLGRERPQLRARNSSPIVPRASIAGRALVAVVAIMTFLASITTGAVLLVSASAAEWQSEVASEITIQVRPQASRDLDRDSAAATEALRAQARVMQVAPSASVDDHRAWIERMRSMTGATVFAGIGILALVIVATIISVSFATRGAMAANRPIVEVLHFVGAGDRFIANRFLRHFLRLGLEGGVIGGGAAMLAFGFSESIVGWFSGTPVGDQFAALLGTFSLRPSGYLVLAVQALLIAGITAWASRRTLFATLDDIE